MSGAWEHAGQRVHINGVVLRWWWVVQCCRVVLAARGVLRRRCARLVEDPCRRGGCCQQVCGANYRNWANAFVRDIDVGPWAYSVCCCGSVRVYFGRVSVCSLKSLTCIQRTYDCSHDGAAELSRSYQCTEQTSVRLVPRVVWTKRGQNPHFCADELRAPLTADLAARPRSFSRRGHGQHS